MSPAFEKFFKVIFPGKFPKNHEIHYERRVPNPSSFPRCHCGEPCFFTCDLTPQPRDNFLNFINNFNMHLLAYSYLQGICLCFLSSFLYKICHFFWLEEILPCALCFHRPQIFLHCLRLVTITIGVIMKFFFCSQTPPISLQGSSLNFV